jgi:hypothetical protein
VRYDSTYAATVATVIPLVFVAIVIDLGLAKRSATPLAAGILLSLVIVLLAAELLCLNALSDRRELRQGEGILVAGAVLFSGTTVLYRVGEPLLKTIVKHSVGKSMVRAFVAGFVVLAILHSARLVSGSTAIVIFAMCALVLGVIVPGFVSGIARIPFGSGQTDDSTPGDGD